ncbi:MAG: hypothetical protein H7101_02870 [Deinococcales bacterium]|nr:hypothetical protein [Chitinophagaceae bacterium]
MKTIILIFVIIIGLNCSKSTTKNNVPEGTYKGTFNRNTSNVVSNVTINLSNINFSGKSDVSRYPAISMGNYQIFSDSIRFIDASIWTADFD